MIVSQEAEKAVRYKYNDDVEATRKFTGNQFTLSSHVMLGTKKGKRVITKMKLFIHKIVSSILQNTKGLFVVNFSAADS